MMITGLPYILVFLQNAITTRHKYRDDDHWPTIYTRFLTECHPYETEVTADDQTGQPYYILVFLQNAVSRRQKSTTDDQTGLHIYSCFLTGCHPYEIEVHG